MNLVKDIFGNYVPQFSFYESLIFGILNSREFQKRDIAPQERVRSYLTSASFKKYIDDFQKSIKIFSIPSFDSEWGKDWFD